jgi:hypothetical protein
VPLPITRGSGVILPPTSSSNGYWGGTSFSTTTADDGISSKKYFTFSLKSKNGKSVNYHSIGKTNIRIGSSGPIKYLLDYTIDDGRTFIIDSITGPTRVTGNYVLDSIDLSTISNLQNVPPISTVTFRMIPYDASGTGSFLIGSGVNDTLPDFEINGGFSDDNIVSTALPVTLTQFKLYRSNSKVILNWQTQSEIDFSHFELERSNNGQSFYPIATINSSNQLSGSNYSYTDVAIANGTKYYRLKMIDKDGSITYSNVLTDVFNNAGMPLMIYPTVSNGTAVKAVFKAVAKPSQLYVVSESGQVVNTYQLQQGASSHTVETGTLSKGVYFLRLISNNILETATFIKQ